MSLIRECPVFRNFEGVKHNINYINITLNVQVDCHVGGGRDGGARRDPCQARDHHSGRGFNICKRETAGYFLRTLRSRAIQQNQVFYYDFVRSCNIKLRLKKRPFAA